MGGADGAGLHVYETESTNEEYQHVEVSEHVEDVTCVATNVSNLPSLLGQGEEEDQTYSYVDSYVVPLHLVEQTVS